MKRIVQYITRPQVIKSLYLLMIIFLICNVALFAQGGSPDGPGGDPNEAPIDGGLSLLVAAGIGYGVKKLKEKKQHKDTDVLNK